MDLNCQSESQPNSDTSNKLHDESTKSPIENRNLKHFKKSMIVEYESGINDDSHSSSSSSSSSSTTSNSSSTSSLSGSSFSTENLPCSSSNTNVIHNEQQTSSTGSQFKNESNNKLTDKQHKNNKAKLDDLYENERSNDEDDDDDDFEADYDENNLNKKKKLLNSSNSSSENSASDTESNEIKNKKKKKNETGPFRASKSVHSKSSKTNTDKKDIGSGSNIQKKKTYCICKSQDSQRFMIACDNCDEWYHGDCVGVTLSLSKKIRTFYCHICRHKKRSLSIKYKSKFQDFLKTYSKSSNHNKLTSQDESLIKFLKETRIREKKENELNRKPGEKIDQTVTKSNYPPSQPHHHHHHNENKPKQKIKNESKQQNPTTSSTFVETCSSSKTVTASTNSVFNFENTPNRVYGKSNISGEDFENFFSAITKLGHDAAQLAAAKATSSESNTNQSEVTNVTIKKETQNEDIPVITPTTKYYSETENENETSNYNEDNNSNSSEIINNNNKYLNNSDFDDKKVSSSKADIKKSKINKTNKTINKSKKQNVKRIGSKNTKQQQNQCQKRQKRTSSSTKLTNDNNNNNNSDDETIQLLTKKSKIQEPIQCFGPECVNEAQQDSKYCSTECGMKLAKNRLVHFLKTRIEQYNESPCYSNILNQNELDRINSEIESLRRNLTDLEQKHLDLDKIIEKAKFKKINPNIEKERENLESNEIEVYCVTCGNLCTEKIALKHMEKCFNKVESQAFFGSYLKSYEHGQSMFCDFYNPQTKMYCKRLKCICPEHEKEKKVNEDEVCGCPLNLLDYSAENDICLASKRNCSLHFKWEKMRRAHIDLEKLRTWLKLEELMDQKRMNETSLNQRAGLLSLLLHQTTSAKNETTNIMQNQQQEQN